MEIRAELGHRRKRGPKLTVMGALASLFFNTKPQGKVNGVATRFSVIVAMRLPSIRRERQGEGSKRF